MDKDVFPSQTRQIKTSCGNIYATVVFNHPKTKIEKILLHYGKAGGCASAHLTSLSSNLSRALQLSMAERILQFSEMTSISCHLPKSCINKLGNYLLDVELKLKER